MRQGFHALLRRVSRRLVAAMLVTAGCSLALPGAWADPPGRVGRLAETHGTVWVYAPDQQEWVQAEVNRPLTSGDRVAVDRGARAEVTIGSTTLRMAGDTELSFTELDDARVQVQLQQGALAARLRDPSSAAQFEVDTPEGRFTPLQPGHYRIDIADDETLALAWAGLLRFDASDSSLTVTADRRAELWREDGATHYSWSEVPDDDFADWVLAADHRDELEAQRQRYVSSDMTGWEDLDRAGRWENSAEYGTLWIPIQVAPDWAPYRDGHWVWMAPWGWTWVDDAPWGFAPFHYGRWLWWGNRWCWSPGSYVAHPVYAPALVGWVGSAPVMGTPSPVVGWVPLAPGEIYYPGYPIGRHHWHALNPHAPLNAYRPRPPSRAAANFVNRRAPGGVTLMPAAGWRRPRAGTVASVAPADTAHAHFTTPAPSTALTRVAAPPRPVQLGSARPSAGSNDDPRRGLPFVRSPGRGQSSLAAQSAAAPPAALPPSPLASGHARPAVPPSETLSTRGAAGADGARRSPALPGLAHDLGPRGHGPAAGRLPVTRGTVVSTDDRPTVPPPPPGFMRHPRVVSDDDAVAPRRDAHRAPPAAVALPPRPPAAVVSPLAVQPMRPPPAVVHGVHGVAPAPVAPKGREAAGRPAPGAERDDRTPAPPQRGLQP